ncbi:MAG: hypothetical protein AB1938_19960 [Myxococcota bacterium]
MGLLLFLGLVVGVVLLLRLARVKGAIHTPMGCQRCGARVPATGVRFFRNTGMIIMFRWETLAGQSCRGCALRDFGGMTLWTLALGWWGLISFFLNWVFLFVNVASVLWALSLPGAVAVARRALDEHREYALNLLATKDFDTVVDVLAKTTGAQHVDVIDWLQSLRTTSPA